MGNGFFVNGERRGGKVYQSIEDLLFIGEAVDLPFYDFVIGIQVFGSQEGVAYNNGEGKKLYEHLKYLDQKSILHLSHQPSPAKEIPKELLKRVGLSSYVVAIGLAIIDPKAEEQVLFVQTPDALLEPENGIVAEYSENLLDMLFRRWLEYKAVTAGENED